MADYDVVCVGSGINCLVAAALLARDGLRVAVFERAGHLGGAIDTRELAPGYLHDMYAVSHALFLGSSAYAELEQELRRRGLVYAYGDVPAATVRPSGESAVLTTDHAANVAEFERHAAGDGETWRRICGEHGRTADLVRELLTRELWSAGTAGVAARALSRLRPRGIVELTGEMLVSCRDWTAQFRSETVRALLAPWTLHAGLGPEAAASGFMTRVMATSLQARGTPMPVGGGARLTGALAGIVREAGGACLTGCGVARVVVERGRAAGVRLDDGDVVTAGRAVVAGVTPTQLYGTLLDGVGGASAAREAAARFRYGRARMQIQIALRERPAWRDPRLLEAATVHVTDGVDAVSRAVNEAERGLLPAEPTVTVAQPVAVDPSRAPAGGWIFSIQLHEVPWRPRGDAAGAIDVRDGLWSERLREQYADRAQRLLARHVPNLDEATLLRVVLSPRELAAANENFVHGDGAGGSVSLDQNLVWRPLPRLPGHATPVRGLFHVGASTHPGPGLGAGSGVIVARTLRRRRVRR